ncbi:hypothetical protein [Pseudomonas sp. NPDC089569]|uniref:hypothetical protein n=1 Tax=Pseudomonas sp. NPDC089569 TaxID=3390722 RepID=UPI003D08DD20
MHIEITDCQRTIPISENNAVRIKSAQPKKAAMPKVKPCNPWSRSLKEQRPHATYGTRRLLDAVDRVLPGIRQKLKENTLRTAREIRTINFRKKLLEKSTFLTYRQAKIALDKH